MLNMPGGPEIMVVLLVALVVLGPEQLPKAMRTFGNVMAQVRKVSNGFQDEMRSAMNTLDVTAASKSGPTPNQGRSAPTNDVIDTVARPDTPGDTGSAAADTPATTPSAVDPVSDRPGASSADRAAG